MTEKELQLQFQIICNTTKMGQEVYIIGNSLELGNWEEHNIREIQKLNCIEFPIWQSRPINFKNKTSLEYKFIIKCPSENKIIEWEKKFQGNRKLDITNFENSLYLIDEGIFNDKSKQNIIDLQGNNFDKGNNIINNDKIIKNDNNIISNTFTFSKKKGLANIGATCYMNATLQCFCHIKKFTDFFKNNLQIINDRRTNTLSYSFKILINELCNDSYDNNSYISPYEFKEKISKMNPLFRGIEANDAKDLVNFIIMTLHEELNKAYKNNKNINNNQFIDQRNAGLVWNNFFNEFNRNNNSIIKDLFYAFNCTITQCLKCKNSLYNFQVYFFLVFPLEEVRKFKLYNNNQFNFINNIHNNEVSIFDCFNYEKKINQMTGANSLYCNFCKINSWSSMKTNLVTGPEILILLLNRGKGLEFNVKIIFEEYLNLYNYIFYKNTGFNYKLIGVITHIGENGNGGHFIAYCRDPISNQWNKYNDSIVTDVVDFKNEVINFANPYLLFYQKYH